MDAIRTFLNSIFQPLPLTKELVQAKNTLLEQMEQRYRNLLTEGMNDQDASDLVIAEFGSLNDRLNELGLSPTRLASPNYMPFSQVKAYLEVRQTNSILITLGVALCILSAAVACFIEQILSNKFLTILLSPDTLDTATAIPLLTMISIAVGLFIFSGTRSDAFHYIEEGITLDPSIIQYLKTELAANKHSQSISTIIGVSLCILSPISVMVCTPLFGDDSGFTGAIFLTIIAIAVSLFVYFGIRTASYEILLEQAKKGAPPLPQSPSLITQEKEV